MVEKNTYAILTSARRAGKTMMSDLELRKLKAANKAPLPPLNAMLTAIRKVNAEQPARINIEHGSK